MPDLHTPPPATRHPTPDTRQAWLTQRLHVPLTRSSAHVVDSGFVCCGALNSTAVFCVGFGVLILPRHWSHTSHCWHSSRFSLGSAGW